MKRLVTRCLTPLAVSVALLCVSGNSMSSGPAINAGLDPDWTAESDQAFSNFGHAVFTAGDVNGDGYSDLIIGSLNYSNPEHDEGRAFLYYGSIAGLELTPAWTAEIDQAWARFGQDVSTAGDVNGDGYDDLIVGAPGYSGTKLNEGAAFVYHGGAMGPSSWPDWMVQGGQEGGTMYKVRCAGDVNGDNYDDVIVGSFLYDVFADSLLYEAGRADVFLGSASGLSTIPAWTAYGDTMWARFGYSVSSAGDVNDDGYDDVAVGAPGPNAPDPVEEVFIYHGSPGGPSSTPDMIIVSPQSDASFGGRVESAGDVNKDGYGDIIVGASGFDNGEYNEGGAFVYHGGPTGLDPVPAWIGEGNQEESGYGTRVAGIGDIDHDGFSDVAVCASVFDGGLDVDKGRVFVYHGTPAGPSPTPTWIRQVNQAGANFGVRLAGAGDVNGDGYSDLAVGAWKYDNGEEDEGGVFVYHGCSEPVPVALVGFEITQVEGEIHLNWAANGLSDTGVFHVQRSCERYQDYLRLNDEPIEGEGAGARTYSFVDDDVIPGTLYYYRLEAVDGESAGVLFGPYAFLVSDWQKEQWLGQNSPNPFGPGAGTTIHYSVGRAGTARLMVFDAKGRLVRTLVDKIQRPGEHAERWDGRDAHGRLLPSGTYFYTLELPGWKATKKMTFSK